MSDETRIRERAYAIWERDGRQNGSHEAHWDQAVRELAAEGGTAEPMVAPADDKTSVPATAPTDGGATPTEVAAAPPAKKRRAAPKRPG